MVGLTTVKCGGDNAEQIWWAQGMPNHRLLWSAVLLHTEDFLDSYLKTCFLYNDVFSIELELISVVSNPKGEIKCPLPESGVDAF